MSPSVPMRAIRLLPLPALLAISACSSPAARGAGDSAGPGAPAAASTEGWIVLFDGTDLDRWRGFKRDDVPASWRVDQGTLAFSPAAEASARGDLMTRDAWRDFELVYSWRVSPGGNSGVMWRVSEDTQYPWQTGPEMQVLDDERHADGKFPSHRAGALYDLVTPPANVAKPVGEWNEARVLAEGSRVRLWLNGTQTADVDFASEEGKRLLAASKFRSMPRFAQNDSGHVVLQDHEDPVWYRDIRIRPIRR